MQKEVGKLMVIVAVIGVCAPASAAVLNVPSQYSTIQAAYANCNPGDTVLVANGTYYERLWLDRSGTACAPITVQAANPGGAVIDAQGIAGPEDLRQVIFIGPHDGQVPPGGWYNVVQGFEITNGREGGISVYGSYNRITKCNIHHNGGTYGGNGIFSASLTTDNRYLGNYIHDNGRISTGSNLDHGLYLCGDNELVANNLIVSNCTYGIQVAGYADGAGVFNMKIYNNTIVASRNKSGIVLWMTLNWVDIANNIFYGNSWYGIDTWDCHGLGVQIRNNLFYANPLGTWRMNGGCPLACSTVSYTTSGNITTSDPLFVNSASDWHLQTGSPAINSGLPVCEVNDDYDGVTRPQGGAYDMGAYER
jgi:hypothetical protein